MAQYNVACLGLLVLCGFVSNVTGQALTQDEQKLLHAMDSDVIRQAVALTDQLTAWKASITTKPRLT